MGQARCLGAASRPLYNGGATSVDAGPLVEPFAGERRGAAAGAGLGRTASWDVFGPHRHADKRQGTPMYTLLGTVVQAWITICLITLVGCGDQNAKWRAQGRERAEQDFAAGKLRLKHHY